VDREQRVDADAAMLAMTLGPSMKPVCAATIKSAPSDASVAQTNQLPTWSPALARFAPKTWVPRSFVFERFGWANPCAGADRLSRQGRPRGDAVAARQRDAQASALTRALPCVHMTTIG
jgi:hypothetical protein